MSQKSLVSIIIPAYNAERYLGAALDSVLAQTYANWEAIVVDDGSKDGTAVLAKSYAVRDKRIKYIFQENQRMAAARNTGILAARGEFVAFLDADNVFLPNKLKVQVDFLVDHPGCGVVYSKVRHFYGEDKEKLFENKNESLVESDQFRSLLWKNSINVLQVVIRKKFFGEYGAFQRWPACDEHYVWVNMARHGVKFCFLDEIVGLAREHHMSDSRRAGHIYDTAEGFLKMLNIVESALSPTDREKYSNDFRNLRRRYGKILFFGRLMKSPVLSWFLVPIYLRRREKAFMPVAA